MRRIILHWTAGTLFPSVFDRQFYHYLVDGSGRVHAGIYPPEANLNVKSGRYAAHTGGGNTASIGVRFVGWLGTSLQIIAENIRLRAFSWSLLLSSAQGFA